MKKQEFINFIRNLMDKNPDEQMNEEAALYWKALQTSNEEKEKPLFSENGKLILKFLQENQETNLWTSKNLGQALGISSRSVSGSMRKLVDNGFVEKMGESPIAYTITEKGINYKFEEE